MLRSKILLGVILVVGTLGCGKSLKAPPAGFPEEGTKKPEPIQVPHPEYAHWSRFDIGSYTVRQKQVAGKNGKTIVTTTVKLADKNEKQVVVETQITVKRGDEPELVNPSFTAEFPAVFSLPEGMAVEQFSKPSLKAELNGEEELVIQDKSYVCTKYTWTEVNEAGPMLVTVWRNDEVPGRTVKELSTTTEAGESSSEEVLEIYIAESKVK